MPIGRLLGYRYARFGPPLIIHVKVGKSTMKEELLKGLTATQKSKILACQKADEISALAKEEGVELTNEQLEAVSGGECDNKDFMQCPSFKKRDLKHLEDHYHEGGVFSCDTVSLCIGIMG